MSDNRHLIHHTWMYQPLPARPRRPDNGALLFQLYMEVFDCSWPKLLMSPLQLLFSACMGHLPST